MAIYEVVLEGRQGAEDMLSVLHYDVTGTAPFDWTALADVFRAHLVDHVQVLCGSNTSWIGLTIRENIAGSVGTFIPFTLGDLIGTAVDPDSITQVAVLVQKLTNTLTRPTQGRIYQGGITARFAAAAGFWETGVTVPLNDFWEDVREVDFAGPSNARMVVVASNPLAPNTVPFNYVQNMVVRSNPVTMRRRKRTSGS